MKELRSKPMKAEEIKELLSKVGVSYTYKEY
jgi:uncharacterized protein with GYD domain